VWHYWIFGWGRFVEGRGESRAVTSVRPETLNLLGTLVAFDTVSSRSNRAFIDHVAARLRDLDICTEILPNGDGEKASLWARIGPSTDGGIVLSGHADVVPVDGQVWQSDPFTMAERGGCVYGRGVADMKGFIACAITAMERHRDAKLRRPIHLTLTYDEELGCLGAPELLDWVGRQHLRPAVALIGEPTSMQVVNAHKGILVARTEITGVEAHSSLANEGISAVELAGEAVVLLQRIEAELADRFRNERFTPDHATISVNRIGGGTAMNILAGQCWFEWNIRAIPGITGAEVLGHFETRLEHEILAPAQASHPRVSARTSVLNDVPGLAPEPDGAAEMLATGLLGANFALAVAFGAEAGQFQQAGLSTVIVGPGSIEQAHKADEFVSLDQLGRCEAFLDRLAATLSG
jgi:acetylornithine deacetylase